MKRKFHHSAISEHGNCSLCGKPIMYYWKDAKEQNGFSDWFHETKEGKVHFFCVPGAKSLKQLNKERKNSFSH